MQTLTKLFPSLKALPETGYISNYPPTYPKKTLEKHLCPCCSSYLLRHVRRRGIYWHCSHCYQEMPALSTLIH